MLSGRLSAPVPVLGVDVEAVGLEGRKARATGILKKWTITQEELDRQMAERWMFSTRGPGTYYRLVKIDSDDPAPAVPLP